jgi:hypothetical protein
MRLRPVALLLIASMLLPAAPAHAWGFAAHRMITRRAIDLLPPELKPFFDRFAEEFVLRSDGKTTRITFSTSACPSTARSRSPSCRATTAWRCRSSAARR